MTASLPDYIEAKRRLKMGWPMDRALSQPVRPQKNNRVAAA